MPAGKDRIFATSLSLVALSLAGCVSPASDAPLAALADLYVAGNLIAFERIHTPEEISATVEAFASLPGVKVDVVGESVEGRPLQKVVVGTGPFELWIVGRHHGNEPTGAEAILQAIPLLADPEATLPADAPPIARFLLENRELVLDRVTFVFVPVVNPDGASRFQRTNVNGQDLNRDYYAFSQPEPQIVRDAFWQHWPDACLDLHNEGMSGTHDYDAFVPVALPEEEMQADLTAAAWRTVYEVDAAGGFGGGPNENYRLGDGDLERQFLNPTAYHPGTHDMFCSVRGAPGWTPEGAIPGATGAPVENGTHPTYAWSTRLHLVTVATAALTAAGVYDGLAAPVVSKVRGNVGQAGSDHLVDIPSRGTVTLQVVWREGAPLDKNPAPLHVQIEDPQGRLHDARLPTPDAFTATARFRDIEAGTYRVNIRGAPGVEYEVRSYLVAAQERPLRVERVFGGLQVANTSPTALDVSLTDVVNGGADVTSFSPAPSLASEWTSPIVARLGLEWRVTLPVGASATISYPAVENPGPWRWSAASADGAIATGIEGARSTT